MKKKMSLILTLIMLTVIMLPVLSSCGSSKQVAGEVPAKTDNSATTTVKENNVNKIGVLAMLNLSEKEMANILKARSLLLKQISEEGYSENLIPEAISANIDGTISYEIVYYDTLDAMVMALNAGDIDSIDIYSDTAAYLSANNDALVQITKLKPLDDNTSFFTKMAYIAIFSNDFAFMMLKDNDALRNEFNSAIENIRNDGTMARLISEHIDKAVTESNIVPVEMPVIDGAETIRVAVTGSLPPMDYVAPDGNPAGFSTALLAEISRRINKNIKLVQVDSIGRAAALAGKTVDAAFWTRTCTRSNDLAKMTQQEKDADWKYLLDNMTEKEREVFSKARDIVDLPDYGTKDMPEGTIITETYYSDILVPVVLKSNIDNLKAKVTSNS